MKLYAQELSGVEIYEPMVGTKEPVVKLEAGKKIWVPSPMGGAWEVYVNDACTCATSKPDGTGVTCMLDWCKVRKCYVCIGMLDNRRAVLADFS